MIPALSDVISSDLQHWLNYFVLEVCKKDGSEYPPDSLHHLCSGIMCFLQANNCPSHHKSLSDAVFSAANLLLWVGLVVGVGLGV